MDKVEDHMKKHPGLLEQIQNSDTGYYEGVTPDEFLEYVLFLKELGEKPGGNFLKKKKVTKKKKHV